MFYGGILKMLITKYCDECGKRMKAAEDREGPYYCSRKQCKKERGKQ